MKRTVNIFILIDALGWSYIKDRPFLDDIAVTKQPVKSILGFSSGVIPSILTGKYPQEHKHWSLYFYSPGTSPFRWTRTLLWLPKPILRTRLARKIIEEISKRVMGYTGYFETYLIPVEQLHLFDICEKRNIYASGGVIGERNVFDVFEKNNVNYKIFSYPLKDKEILFKARESIAKQEASTYFLYLSDSDALLHRACKDEVAVKNMIDHYEQEFRNLYKLAKNQYNDVNFFIFSDHGMAAVDRSCDIKAQIDDLNLKVPNDYVVFYDSTMARFWFFSESAKMKISTLLSSQQSGCLINKEEMAELGIDFKGSLYGEAVFLMKTGEVINPSFMNNKIPEGMHGFDINDGVMDATLVSNKPMLNGIKDVRGFFDIMTNGLDKKIKVLYFLNSTIRGGVEEHALQLIKHLNRNLFEPILVCPQELISLLRKDLDDISIPVKTYPISITRWRNIKAILKFLRVLKKENPDIVHSHLFYATRFAAPLAKLAGVPLVIDTSHLREAWRKGIKKAYFIDRFFYGYVDKIIAVSNAVKEYLINEKRLPPDKITVVHNGVDLKRFKFSDARLEHAHMTIGVIGRLEPQKGHKYFIEAMNMLDGKLKDTDVYIIGEGSLRKELEQLSRNLNIKFLGFRSDITSVLQNLDIVVLPSLYEGLPLIALEAGAMQKPIIATAVDGSKEAVKDGITGMLVPAADSVALKKAIETLLNDAVMRDSLGRQGRQYVSDNFSMAKQLKETENLYS